MHMTNKKHIPDIYQTIHCYCSENERILRAHIECVCIYCGKKMEYSDILFWIKDRKGKTAVCPECGIDCVVPIAIDGVYKLNDEMVKEMNKLYF